MAKKEKSYAELAAGNRRWAKVSRGLSIAFAAVFVVMLGGVVWALATTDWQAALTVGMSAVVTGLSAFSIRESAKGFEDSAASWDRLAARPF